MKRADQEDNQLILAPSFVQGAASHLEDTRLLLTELPGDGELGRGIGHLPTREWPKCGRQPCAAVWRARGVRRAWSQQSLTTCIIGRTRAGRAAPAGPTRRGQDGEPSEPRQGSAELTDLLTTALDHHGRRGTEKPREQGRCDRLDSCGRL
jgi:hypothetical protein